MCLHLFGLPAVGDGRSHLQPAATSRAACLRDGGGGALPLHVLALRRVRTPWPHSLARLPSSSLIL